MTLTPAKVLHLVAAIIFGIVAAGVGHIGVLQLLPVGLFFLALGFVV